MEKQFIPFKQALALNKLGYKEDCLAYFINKHLQTTAYNTLKQADLDKLNKGKEENTFIAAPLWQQAFDWFRTTYSLASYLDRDGGWWIPTIKDFTMEDFEPPREQEIEYACFNTYEEARLACLKKLIELIQDKD